MNNDILHRIADGRTDLVFDWVAQGQPATNQLLDIQVVPLAGNHIELRLLTSGPARGEHRVGYGLGELSLGLTLGVGVLRCRRSEVEAWVLRWDSKRRFANGRS